MPNEKTNSFVSNAGLEGIIEALYRSCERFKDATAIECGDRRVSYDELDQNANKLANCLLANGLAKGSIVAVILSDRIQIITALIGILRAGCVFVPLDSDGPEARRDQMIENLAPDCFVLEPTLAKSTEKIEALFGYPASRARIVIFGEKAPLPNSQKIDGFSSERSSVSHGPEDSCYVYHTSGSTGVPKGIVGRLKSLSHFIKWEIDTFGISPGYRVSQLTSPTFDPFLRDVLVPLCVGGTVCIPPERSTVLDPGRLIDWLDSNQINLVHCVPFLFNAIVNEYPDAKRFAALKYLMMAGETAQVSDVKKWTETYGSRITLVNLYGPTETTMVKFYHIIQQSDLMRGFIPIGKPMKGAKAIILDPEGNVCSPGVVGELYIRTPYLTLGYYKDPELTKEVFVKNPLTGDANDVVYKTGDLARVLSDGNFQFIGRSDSQVKIRGNRVEIGEIENALQRHDHIKNVVVTVTDDLPGGRRLIAYVVPELGTVLDIKELRRFLNQRLPEYMMPSVFVQLDELPLTPNGKVDRRALPVPEFSQVKLQQDFIEPRDSIEIIMAGIWSDLLGLERVGILDDFFELGGHSMLAAQIISRVRDAFHVELPLSSIFEKPTVAGLSHLVGEAQKLRSEVELPTIRALPREPRRRIVY
jgi:amino acid adenylation domain-containing protein